MATIDVSHLEDKDDENKGQNGEKSFQMQPLLDEVFKTGKVKEIIQKVLQETLTDKTYNAQDAGKWTREISDRVSRLVLELNMKRFKHVVQTIMGQQSGAGCKYITRCLWDTSSDNNVSDFFSNANLFCVVTVFGIYLY